MIAKVKDAGEAGAGELGLVPGAVGQLGLEQVIDAAADAAGEKRAPGGDQAERGPGRLRGSRLAGPLQRRVVVAPAGFAPAPEGCWVDSSQSAALSRAG